MALNSFFLAFSHDDTFRNGIKSDLYMGFNVGFMVRVTLLWVWSYLSLFVLGKWDRWDCLISLPIHGLQHYFGMHCTVAPSHLPFLDAMFSKGTITSKFCPIPFGILNGLQLLLILPLVCSFWSESLRYKHVLHHRSIESLTYILLFILFICVNYSMSTIS